MTTPTLFDLTPTPDPQPAPALHILPRPAAFDAATWQASDACPTPWHLPYEQCRAVMAHRRAQDAEARHQQADAFEKRWKANEKELSYIPVPPVPHVHAMVEVEHKQHRDTFLYFDANGESLTNSKTLPIGGRYQTVSSPAAFPTEKPAFQGWWRGEWRVVWAASIRGEMCRQYAVIGEPYPLSEFEVAMWLERANVSAKTQAA